MLFAKKAAEMIKFHGILPGIKDNDWIKRRNLDTKVMLSSVDSMHVNYRLITVFTFSSECRLNDAHLLRFWCVKCTNSKGECTGQASKLKCKCIILSKFLAQSKYAVINLIHTRQKRTFKSFLCDK